MSKTIGVIGTRSRDSEEDFKEVWREFGKWYEPGDKICSGLCPKGGDRFAVVIANKLNFNEEERIWYPANWDKNGKAAGFIRNIDIARESDILIACVSSDRTGGTEDTIKKFLINHQRDRLSIVE